MAQKHLKGVGGVLSNLISPPGPLTPTRPDAGQGGDQDVPQAEVAEELPEQHPQTPPEVPAPREEVPVRRREPAGGAEPRKKSEARRGRPPAGSRPVEPVEREKVSLRLRADLAATYRDWSWEERCQFSDLVDRALEHYLKSRGKARKPERE